MAHAWPWTPILRSTPPRLIGDLDAVLALGLWSDRAALELTAAALAASVPTDIPVEVKFEVTALDVCAVSIDAPDCKIAKRFIRCDRAWEVAFDLFWMPEHLQGTGMAKRLFLNLAIVYGGLGIVFIHIHANYTIGGYTWAKLAGRVIEPDLHRDLLLKRLAVVASQEKYTPWEVQGLERVIKHAPSESLMYDLARCVNGRGAPIGKPLLLGYSWDAFWDLSDPLHRTTIIEALNA